MADHALVFYILDKMHINLGSQRSSQQDLHDPELDSYLRCTYTATQPETPLSASLLLLSLGLWMQITKSRRDSSSGISNSRSSILSESKMKIDIRQRLPLHRSYHEDRQGLHSWRRRPPPQDAAFFAPSSCARSSPPRPWPSLGDANNKYYEGGTICNPRKKCCSISRD